MDLNELKEKIHREVEALNDPTALQLLHEAASGFATLKQPDILDSLTGDQLEKLNTSLAQANAGNTIPHADALKKIEQWRCK